jgi:Ribonuclease G/E
MNYDTWKASVPDADEILSTRCPVCTGHEEAHPCSEECEEIIRRCARQRQIASLYKGARRCVYYARQYTLAKYPEHNVIAVLEQVRAYRSRIRELRAA